MNLLDRTVASMMSKFGTTAQVVVVTNEYYDPSSSENVVTTLEYDVSALIFDFIRKGDGLGTENNTLIQTGDKQVFIQPPDKIGGVPLPHILPNRDKIRINGTLYKIIVLKQDNMSITQQGCVMYELFVRA